MMKGAIATGKKALTAVRPSMMKAARKSLPSIPRLLFARGSEGKANVAKDIGKNFLRNTADDVRRRLGVKNIRAPVARPVARPVTRPVARSMRRPGRPLGKRVLRK